jgi:hypothetical protein
VTSWNGSRVTSYAAGCNWERDVKNDDFITTEYKKVRGREEMSRYNYDTQEAG